MARVIKTKKKTSAKAKDATAGPAGKKTTGRKPAGKSLVIVESPAKAKTIHRYLGGNYLVMASLGHIKDLPRNKLGVDVEDGFRPTYQEIPSRAKVIRELKKTVKNASVIYLAADPDREGEAICQHLAEELQNGKKIHRVTFNEITRNSIRKAFENPGEIDGRLVAAQQARRILDRLVGYQVSPLLWDKVRRGISAGRVQTVALRLIVERDREIRDFQREEYWTITARLGAQSPPSFDARLVKRQGKDVITGGESGNRTIQAQSDKGKFLIGSEGAAQSIRDALASEKFVVDSTTTKERRRNPVPPFITSKLQQEAARRLRFSVKRTMVLAQRLYEGVECGAEGVVGLITYMRSDSTRVSQDALAEARNHIRSSYGDAYLPGKPNFFRSKKGAQDAHEAIRPTSVLRTPDQMIPYLSEDEAKLYRLIWQRFVASQMLPALFDQTIIEIRAGEFGLRASGSVRKFDGFLKVYEEAKEQDTVALRSDSPSANQQVNQEDEPMQHTLPPVTAGERLQMHRVNPEQHFTEPPPRYNEATLVKELEEKGIGRPSTYVSILSTIQDREYVQKQQNRYFPTELGTVVTDLLVENFSDIFDVAYTAKMENALDEIEDGKQEWVAALGDFYKKFAKDLQHAKKHMANLKTMGKPTDLLCEKCGNSMVVKWGRHGSFLACLAYPECTNTREVTAALTDLNVSEIRDREPDKHCENCGRPMVLKRGRFGQFLACSGYPDCKTTRQLGQGEKKPATPTDENCPQCNNKLVIRQGRFGEFTACSNYPKCKYVKQKTIGVQCPECNQGQLVEKRSRWGKTYYSCERYPDCKHSVRDKPIPQQCPQCGSAFLLEKTNKSGTVLECPSANCDYEHAA